MADYVGQSAAIGDAPWWGGGFGLLGAGRGVFASPESNAVRIDANGRASAAAFENLLDQNQFASTNRNITECCNRVSDQQVNGEFRTADRLRDIERQIQDNRAEAAKCCCDLKLQMCEDKAELKADILAVESRSIERALNAANAELTALKTQIACGCCPPQGN